MRIVKDEKGSFKADVVFAEILKILVFIPLEAHVSAGHRIQFSGSHFICQYNCTYSFHTRRARHAVPLRDEFAGGFSEDFCVEVDVGFGGGGAH